MRVPAPGSGNRQQVDALAKPYAKVEIGYTKHPKFIVLDAWAFSLWHEAKDWCAMHHTDGLIPRDALKAFKYARKAAVVQLLTAVVPHGNGLLAPLWEIHEIGFKMHDYLEHNDCREVVLARIADADDKRELRNLKNRDRQRAFRERRKAAIEAKLNGECNAESSVTSVTVTPPLSTPTTTTTTTVQILKEQESVARARDHLRSDVPPLDRWFGELKAAYPPNAVSSGHLTEQAFVDAVLSKGTPDVTFTVMFANLEAQKRGQQWAQKRMIPRLDRWLRDGLWEQHHEPIDAPKPPGESAEDYLE